MKLFGARRTEQTKPASDQGVSRETLDLLRSGAAFGSVSAIPNGRLLCEELTAGVDLQGVEVKGKLGQNCWLVRDAKFVGDCAIKIMIAPGKEIENVVIRIGRVPGKLNLRLSGNNSALAVGRCQPCQLNVDLGRYAMASVGDATSVVNLRLIADRGDVQIGRDCLIAGQVTMNASFQHSLVDAETGDLISERPVMTLGDHVWLGMNTMLVGNCTIGDGSILGAGAVAAGTYPEMSVVAGNPARVLRSGVTWCRPWDQLDAGTEEFLSRKKQAGAKADAARADLTVLPAMED